VEKEFPKRKHPRLDCYDYSSDGFYFVTICTQNKRCLLSKIVGRGLAPDEKEVEYTELGKIAEEQLLLLEKRYCCVKIDCYVVMPNHIHAVFIIANNTAGASPRPTLMDIVCSYKSLTTKECRKVGFSHKLFQSSFYEHIIRGQADYDEIIKYICDNPTQWYYDKLYCEQ